MYIDGSSIGTISNCNPDFSNATLFSIGQEWDAAGTGDFFSGQISNVQIFNTALTDGTGGTVNQIEAIYNNGKPLTDMNSFSSLVSWWKLDNTTTGIEDSKGSNNGTNNGATEVIGSVSVKNATTWQVPESNLINQTGLLTFKSYSPYALAFDGNDYIDCGTPSTFAFGTGDFTISGWVYLDSSTNYQWLFSTGTNFAFGVDSSRNLQLWVGGTATTPSFNINLNQWHHSAATRNSGTVTFYIDGSAFGTTYSRTGSIAAGSYNYIGTFNVNQNHLHGRISNVSIWNAALTPAQVTEIYNEGRPSNLNNFSGTAPVAWWQLGSNSSWTSPAWTVLDEIGSNDGTSNSMLENAITDGVGTSGNGTSTNMSLANNISGSSPNGEGNSLSVNMTLANIAGGVN